MYPFVLLALALALLVFRHGLVDLLRAAHGQYSTDVGNRKTLVLLTLTGGDDQTGEWFDVRGARDVGFGLAMTVLTGGVLDVKIQTSPDKQKVFDLAGGAFTQQADGVPLSQELAPANVGIVMRYVRVIADQAAGVSATTGYCVMTFQGGHLAPQQTTGIPVTG